MKMNTLFLILLLILGLVSGFFLGRVAPKNNVSQFFGKAQERTPASERPINYSANTESGQYFWGRIWITKHEPNKQLQESCDPNFPIAIEMIGKEAKEAFLGVTEPSYIYYVCVKR